jgi:hypothetical protein
MKSTSGTGGALRAATYSEVKYAIMESEAFVDVYVMPSMLVHDVNGLGQLSVSASTVCCREQAGGPIVDVCTLLTFLRYMHDESPDDAPTMAVRWTGEGELGSETQETAGERDALTHAEMRLRSMGATMMADGSPSTNRVAHAAVLHMNNLRHSLKALMRAMPCGSGATDGNR